MTWAVVENPNAFETHVVPVKDLRPHTISTPCWCEPYQDAEQPMVWIHNAADQREKFETGERKPS